MSIIEIDELDNCLISRRRPGRPKIIKNLALTRDIKFSCEEEKDIHIHRIEQELNNRKNIGKYYGFCVMNLSNPENC